MARTARSQSRQVNLVQALALLLTFVTLAGVGGILTAGLVLPLAASTSTVTTEAVKVFDDLPTDLGAMEPSEQSRIYAADGVTLLATFYAENRIVVPLDRISENMKNAVIAIEDRRFYHHGGVDPTGMLRALAINTFTDEIQGASTLTQQYVKNVLIDKANRAGDDLALQQARSVTTERKLREAKLALALEKSLSKEEILEGYLNIAQFGASVYGVETAAQFYFGKSAADLSAVEAATIAGTTQAPNRWDPVAKPEDAEQRRNIVLGAMYREGYIAKEEYEAARATPLPDTLNLHQPQLGCDAAGGAAYFCDYVTKVIVSDPAFGETKADREQLLYRGGLDIYTTLDLRMQASADAEVRASVPTDNAYNLAMALSTVEPGTGKILAMAQNRAYNSNVASRGPTDTTVNYNTDQLHGGSKGFSPGSTFKTFVLAEWLRSGHTLNEVVSANKRAWPQSTFKASCLGDNPFRGTKDWSVSNSDGQGTGPKTVLEATAKSINTAYATMATQLDLCAVAETAKQVGFRPSLAVDQQAMADDPDTSVLGAAIRPSMILGTVNTSPLAMAAAYATFAAGGKYCEPIAITRVVRDDQELDVPPSTCRVVLDAKTNGGVVHALQAVMTTGSGNKAQLPNRPSAGKTGTADQNKHTWFAGFTPQLATAVWMGNPDGDVPMRGIRINGKTYRYLYGSDIAAPTWSRYMATALEGAPVLTFPEVDGTALNGEQLPVPTVYGRSVEEAQRLITEAGFSAAVDQTPVDSTAPAGTVAYTTPGRGGASRGATVTIRISNGNPPPAPPQPTADPAADPAAGQPGAQP